MSITWAVSATRDDDADEEFHASRHDDLAAAKVQVMDLILASNQVTVHFKHRRLYDEWRVEPLGETPFHIILLGVPAY